MSDGVLITFMICATLIGLSLIGSHNQNNKDR